MNDLKLNGDIVFEFAKNCRRLFVKPDDEIGKLLHAAVGVAGESGELLDAIKKTWIYGKPLDRENLVEECGDALFYISVLLDNCGSSLQEAMQENIDKLNKRYPVGYTDQAAQERADKEPTK